MKKIIILTLILLSSLSLGISAAAAEGDPIIGPDVIYKQYDKVLTMSTIKSLYTADEEIEITYDEYTGYGNIPAMYDVTLTAGEQTKDIIISVRQTLGNVIAVTYQNEEYTIHVYKNVLLEFEDIKDILVRINYITVTSTTQLFTLTNNYTENASAPGNYTFEFMLATTSGYEEIHEINIRVTNSEELTPDIVIQPGVNANLFVMIFTFENVLLFIVFIIVIIIAYQYFNKKKKTQKRGK
ncbi:MAG: hypothetical protein RBT45_08635 [Acholeplasmataceae bacterium]|jgi:hypothetical protein|nr:hypothetical protein [Acholeplasmataceae bacterium]